MTQSDSTRPTSSESTTSQLKIYRGDRTESYGKKIYSQLKKLSVPLDFKEKVGFCVAFGATSKKIYLLKVTATDFYSFFVEIQNAILRYGFCCSSAETNNEAT